jgi:hypothetical protein
VSLLIKKFINYFVVFIEFNHVLLALLYGAILKIALSNDDGTK